MQGNMQADAQSVMRLQAHAQVSKLKMKQKDVEQLHSNFVS